MQARLWACGRGDVSTPSFGSLLNPISTRGADYAHPIYWFPHQVLTATGAPVMTNQAEKFDGRIAKDLNVLRCIECLDLSQENINKIFVDAIQVFHMPSDTEFEIKRF